MCAIFGSKDKQKFLELAELNQYRGNHSWSTTCFVTGRFEHYANADRVKHILTYRGEGEFEDKVTGFPEDNKDGFITYYLGHVQAPTTDSRDSHPSDIDSDLLWHNGIIKDYQVEEWQHKYGHLKWDTELLYRHLLFGNSLDVVDGTFSCARYDKQDLYLFRNEISPLFYDEDLNISSTKFENSKDTEAGVMYFMNLQRSELEPMKRFETKENPYYFG